MSSKLAKACFTLLFVGKEGFNSSQSFFCPDLLPGLQMVLADQSSLSGTAFLLMEVGSGVFSLKFPE